MNKLFLIIIDGMTGAGKTTISKIILKKIPRIAGIGMDKIKFFISDFERGERDNTIARDVVFEMTKTYFKHNISVIIDQPFTSEEELKRYENFTQEHSINIHKFQLFTTPELAFKRVITRQTNRDIKVPEERIKHNISLFESKKNKGFITIDTSNITDIEVVEKILKEIEKSCFIGIEK